MNQLAEKVLACRELTDAEKLAITLALVGKEEFRRIMVEAMDHTPVAQRWFGARA